MNNLRVLGLIFIFFLLPFHGAEAVPNATTQVVGGCEVQAGGNYGIDQYNSQPQEYEQSLELSLAIAGAMAEGYVTATFGPGIPQIGNITSSFQAGSVNGMARGSFGATVMYYFEILLIGPDPGVSTIPVLFKCTRRRL